MTSAILLLGDGRRRHETIDSRRRSSSPSVCWRGSWCQPASAFLVVQLLMGSLILVVHGHIPSMSKSHLFRSPPSTSPALPAARTVPHLASATSAFVGEPNDPLYAQEVVVSEEDEELLSSNNNNNIIHVPQVSINSKGSSSLVNSDGPSNRQQGCWKINFGDVVVADGKANANQGDTDVLSMVPAAATGAGGQTSPAARRPARPFPSLLVTSSLQSESNHQNVTIISTNTISVPIAKNKPTPKMRNNNNKAAPLRGIGISLPATDAPPPPTTEEEEDKSPGISPSLLNLVPVYPVPYTEVAASKESGTMRKIGPLNSLVTSTAASPPAATIGRLEKQLETFADAQMHIQVAPMRTRLPRSHALKALAISFNTGFKATDDDANYDAAINGNRRPVIDLPDSALTSSEETTTPAPIQQTPSPVPTTMPSSHDVSTNTEQPSTSSCLWPAAMRPRLSSLIVPPNDEMNNKLEGTSSTSVSCKRSTTNKKKKTSSGNNKNKLGAGSGSKAELSKSLEALSPSHPESRDVTSKEDDDDDDADDGISEEKLSTTAVTSQEKQQETSIHDEEEKPATHPPNYFKRLSAGDRGVLDDQNRHLPQMKEEDIDAWFRINEKHWTHAATIVYHHAGQKISMFTKQKPEKPTRKKSSKKKSKKKKKKSRREPSNKNKFVVVRSGDRR